MFYKIHKSFLNPVTGDEVDSINFAIKGKKFFDLEKILTSMGYKIECERIEEFDSYKINRQGLFKNEAGEIYMVVGVGTFYNDGEKYHFNIALIKLKRQ